MIQEYKNQAGEDCVSIENPDGSIWSGLKSAYDEMIAQSTLPSNSADPAEKPKK